jgi:hypothetical protein
MVAFEYGPNEEEPWCSFSFPPLTDEEVNQIVYGEEINAEEIAAKCAKYEVQDET